MDDIFVAQLMTSEVETVSPDTLVEDAAKRILDRKIGSVLVTSDGEHLEGILTKTDFVRIVAERQPKDQTPVSAYMSSDLLTANPQDSIRDVADSMLDHGFHHMPVVDETGAAIGIITTTDLAAYLSHVRGPSP